MITKIILDNIYSKNNKLEYIIPNRLMGKNSTIDEWCGLDSNIEIIRKVKNLFSYNYNIIVDFECNPERESTIEIEMKKKDKVYTYSIVFYESSVVMESFLENHNWIFSRFIDNSDFALDSSYLNDKGKECYRYYKDIHSISLLPYFIPGEELLKDLKSIIIVDDWIKMEHQDFIRNFESTFPDLSYNDLINKLIKFGFSDSFDGLERDNITLRSAYKPELKIELEFAGSGFIRLSKLFPLMVASKKKSLMLISTDPYDLNLHPILGKSLMTWFLKDNLNPPIGKLINIEI